MCIDGVRFAGGKDNGLALANGKRSSRDEKLPFAIKNHHKRIERRGMFAERFTFVERKECNGSRSPFKYLPADDRSFGILDGTGKGKNG